MYRASKSTARITPASRQAAIIRSARSRLTSTGLVVMTCLPASAAAMAKSAWVPLGVITVMTSISSRSSSRAVVPVPFDTVLRRGLPAPLLVELRHRHEPRAFRLAYETGAHRPHAKPYHAETDGIGAQVELLFM